MKKKVFFVLSSLRAGGSERVYWTLSQFLNKEVYDVSLVILDSRNGFFSSKLAGVNLIHLNTIRASRSFFKLYHLIRTEKPYAVFTTGGHINGLLAFISLFTSIPFLIGREACFAEIMEKYGNSIDRIGNLFIKNIYRRFNTGICQSEEIRNSLIVRYGIPGAKLKVIPNPVIPTEIIKDDYYRSERRLIYVGRLSEEKGPYRLLEIFSQLPRDYTLTIAGTGPLMSDLIEKYKQAGILDRVNFLGAVSNITELIAKHDLTLLTSFTEGFPNVLIESLSVGVPVVSFRVSGISAIVENDFNGYIIEQDDLQSFKERVIASCNKSWETLAIKEHANKKFSVYQIAKQYESLIQPELSERPVARCIPQEVSHPEFI